MLSKHSLANAGDETTAAQPRADASAKFERPAKRRLFSIITPRTHALPSIPFARRHAPIDARRSWCVRCITAWP